MTRILVTGSRAWPYMAAVWSALNDQEKQYGPIVVVHGHCPTGTDLHAHQWVTTMRAIRAGHTEEKHPADWNTFGRRAGAIRNQEMVDATATLCLAFPYGKSPGTRDCMHRAKLAGIRVIDLGTNPTDTEREETEGLW